MTDCIFEPCTRCSGDAGCDLCGGSGKTCKVHARAGALCEEEASDGQDSMALRTEELCEQAERNDHD